MRVVLRIRPRGGIRDPQGEAVAQALRSLGFDEVVSVRQGKLVELELATADAAGARERVGEMADALLVNRIIEDFEIESGS